MTDAQGKVQGIGVPALRSPRDGLRLLTTSVQFSWGATEDALGYELQYSQDEDFKDNRSRVFQNLPDSNAHANIPDIELSAGKWFWRVRAMTYDGIFGNWSPVRVFTTVASLKKSRQERPITPRHPLFIVHNEGSEAILEQWRNIPDGLKPYFVLRVEKHVTEELLPLCDLVQEHGIPVLIQLAGPHDSYSRRYSRIPLPDVEHIFQTYPAVKGVQIVEQSCQGGVAQARVVKYLIGMMRLASSYGKIAVWADGQWHGNNVWIDAALHAELYRVIQECGDALVPTWKMNCGWMPYAVQGPIFGMWISGAVDNWGVEPESWFWYEAGFHGLGEQRDFKEGDVDKCPLPFWGQMALMGLSGGAAVYSFEPPHSLWERDGKLSESGRKVILPLLSRIVEWGLVPGREEVRRAIRIAYMASDADTPWRRDGGPLATVFEGTYGLDHPFQLIPCTGRYGWMPVLSPFTDALQRERFSALIAANSFRKASDVRAFFEPEYPRVAGGSAWSVKAGSTWAVSNHHENRDARETFSIPVGERISRVEGELDVNGYLVVSMNGDRTVRIHANGRGDRKAGIRILVKDAAEPSVQASPPAGLLHSRYNSGTRTLACELGFSAGAVDLVVTVD